MQGSHAYKWLQFIADLYAASELLPRVQKMQQAFSESVASIYNNSSLQNKDSHLRDAIKAYDHDTQQQKISNNPLTEQASSKIMQQLHKQIEEESTEDTDEEENQEDTKET